MRKLLILMLVLGIASAANAALSIVGPTNINKDGTKTIGIVSDSATGQVVYLSFKYVSEGGFVLSDPRSPILPPPIPPITTPYDSIEFELLFDSPDIMAGTWFEVDLTCLKAGVDVLVELYDSAWPRNLLDSLTIHQISGPYVSNPDPADGAMIPGEIYEGPTTHIWTMLTFSPGTTAVKHTGYFSDDYSKVENRAEDANLGQPPYYSFPEWEYTFFVGHPAVPPAIYSLVRDTTYYWCVDETDGNNVVWQGPVWSFYVQSYYATRPDPPNEGLLISTTPLLSWLPGFSVEKHDIYIGTSWEDVNNAEYDHYNLPPEFKDTRSDPNYQVVTPLPSNTKIYWRVDEVVGRSPPDFIPTEFYKGNVWSFTTVPPVAKTYHVDGVNGDNADDGLSRETAFETIQFAIDEANDNDTILVWPGVYNETATHGINFKGKALTIKSAADAAVLEVPGFTAVSFVQGEDENSVFSNFVVRGSSTGIFALFANPTINNVTVVNNDNGVIADNANPLISNSIFWNNTNGDLFGSPDPITAQYSFIQDEIEANLTAYYSFDDPNDPGHDDSDNGYDVTIYGPNWVTGQVGGALSFDGVGYVDCGTSFASVTTSITKSIIAWVKSAEGMGANILVLYRRSDSGSCFSITAESTPAVWSGIYMKSATTAGLLDSETPVVVNKWTHIALVQDGTNVDIYVNGVSENNSSDAAAPTLSNPPNATIGTYFYGGPTCFFNGTIDDVRIYDRALSAEEIQAIYEAGLAGQEYGPLPLFADANNGDYHLLSERGRYRATTDEWILDKVTSPCVDGGDPSIKPSNERTPNGGIINMGAYGNTAYASMSEWPIKGDVNNDGRFNFMDIAILLDGWLQELPWNQ